MGMISQGPLVGRALIWAEKLGGCRSQSRTIAGDGLLCCERAVSVDLGPTSTRLVGQETKGLGYFFAKMLFIDTVMRSGSVNKDA